MFSAFNTHQLMSPLMHDSAESSSHISQQIETRYHNGQQQLSFGEPFESELQGIPPGKSQASGAKRA